LPVIEVTELSGEESVRAWAEARRGARVLQEKGYFAPNAREDAAGGSPGVAGARKALVIEDDESIAQLLEMLLSEKGFVVSAAADIGDAVSMLDPDCGYDLVLLDVVLPGAAGKDGFHILERIRKTPQLQHLPVIMVTSQVSDAQVLRGLKAGADGYIFKPIKWEALFQCIRSVSGV
jgi:CheY-like chemotaxis protein